MGQKFCIFNRRWRVPPATWLPGERPKVFGALSISLDIIRQTYMDIYGNSCYNINDAR